MFPLYDKQRLSGHKTYARFALIALNIVLFLFSLPHLDQIIQQFGLIPSRLVQGNAPYTLFTAMFLHAGFGHLIGNMWFLWVFGKNMEKKLGSMRFLLFYLVCGLLSGAAYIGLAPHRLVPAIGASGAISGLLGGYLLLFPRHKIATLVPIFFFLNLMAVPAVIFIGIWFLYQLLYIGTQTMIAYWAHIAGFLSGLILIKLFIYKTSAPKGYKTKWI